MTTLHDNTTLCDIMLTATRGVVLWSDGTALCVRRSGTWALRSGVGLEQRWLLDGVEGEPLARDLTPEEKRLLDWMHAEILKSWVEWLPRLQQLNAECRARKAHLPAT